MIELRNVVVAYESRVILDSVNLTINDGETLVILGGITSLINRFTTSYIRADYRRWHRYNYII